MERDGNKTRVPVQKRSIDKKNRIMKAAMDLFISKGYDNTDTKEISKSAGVSVGTLYSYFEDKKSLLIEIMRESVPRPIRQLLNVESELIQKTEDVKELIFSLIKFIIEIKEVPHRMLKQVIALRYTDPDIERLHREEEDLFVESIKSLLELYKDRLAVKDLDVAAKMVIIIIKESNLTFKVFKPRIKKDRFIEELTNVVYKYLFVKG